MNDPFAIVPQTFLARIAPETVRVVLEGARLLTMPAGRLLPHTPRSAGVAIVLEGLVRAFLRSPKERQVTVRYARPGETLGLVHFFGGKLEVHSQAVTATKLWLLSRRRLREQMASSPELAIAMGEECAARVADEVEEIALLTFGSVRQHVARHLLDLAAGQAQGEELIARVTHQELADATGSVREVVARVLKELETRSLVERRAKGVVITQAAGLDAEARGVEMRPVSASQSPMKGRRSRAG